MLAGSFASSIHGLARTTADIDLVIDPTASSIQRLLDQLDRERFYVDDEECRRAVQIRSLCNVIDIGSGWKIDLIIRKDRPFSINEFGRRVPATVVGVDVFVATAEDTVLAKLEWSRGGSERQVRDVVEILRVQGPSIDDSYLDRWAGVLAISDELASARRLTRPD